MDATHATDHKTSPGLSSFSRPQDKSPRTSAFFPNTTVFSSINSFTSLINQNKKTEGLTSIPLLDELQDIPLKKTKSENSAAPVNMFSRIDSKFTPAQGAQDKAKSAATQGTNERESMKEYIESSENNGENAVKEEVTKIEGGIKVEEEKPLQQFVPIQYPSQAKIDQQDAYRMMFSTLVREYEMHCKQQIEGLLELEKWYLSDVPFSPPIPESIHTLLLDRLTRKLKVDKEAGTIINKVTKVFEINNEYREKSKDYLQSKGIGMNNGTAQAEKKADKTKVIVLDGNYDASNSKIGNKRTFQELEGNEKSKEAQEQA